MTADSQAEREAADFRETRSLDELIEWVDSALVESNRSAEDMVPRLVAAARAAGRGEAAEELADVKRSLAFAEVRQDVTTIDALATVLRLDQMQARIEAILDRVARYLEDGSRSAISAAKSNTEQARALLSEGAEG